ncbi:hypothetical protein [Schumannella soli]|uniref:HK97 gp10 family phage protein n=1 Tax=Schumannella soli TaxID=2590779 RepID=A0A506Y387_9MICO|nr:hypothetical protein [Schumannella soli]TPW75897.1 hypothetical protein FJ657_08600 [Schumannella soli]
MRTGYDVKELRAAALLLKGMDREVSAQINKATKIVIGPVWKQAVVENCTTALEVQVLGRTARVDVKNYGVIVRAGGGTKKLSGGARNSDIARATEFGANRYLINEVRRGRRARPHRRHTQRQFVQSRAEGPFYRAVAQVTPRLAALWAQTTVRTFWEVMK